MNVAEKAAKVREGLEFAVAESDAKTQERVEAAVNACGDYSLARLYDFIQEAILATKPMTAEDTFNSTTGNARRAPN
jgi:hypothetical protein